MSRLGIIGAVLAAGYGVLGAGTWAASQAADDRPAVFQVTPEVIAKAPGRYTATFDNGPVNAWMNAGYEPIHFRTKIHATGDSPNQIIAASSEISSYNTYKSGLFDGATARIYRARDGKLVLVRTDTIKAHHSSGWHDMEGFGRVLVAPTAREVRFTLPQWWRESADQWVTVVSVDKSGGESVAATPVKFTVPAAPARAPAKPENPTAQPPRNATGAANQDLAAPTNLKLQVDPETRVFTLSWDAPDSPNVIGFKPRISDDAPERHEGFRLILSQSPADASQHVKAGDMVFIDHQMTSLDRARLLSNRVFGANQTKFGGEIPFDLNAGRGAWALVKHPAPVPPQFAEGGETCLMLDLADDKPVEIKGGKFGHLAQSFYDVLDPAKTYVVEFWAREEGLADTTASFEFRQSSYRNNDKVGTTFKLTEGWQKHSAELRVPFILEKSQPIGEMVLSFKGPGKVWLDNVRVYEKGTAFMDFFAEDYAELERSNLEALRTHSHIKSERGYSMQMLTNPPGAAGYRGTRMHSPHTLASWLSIFEKAKLNPWLQIEMCMSEDEWLGFVEYIAAPYDPAVDSPEKKPWAFKRFSQGRVKPWADSFSKIYFEISNETWNPLFAPWNFLGRTMPDESTGKTHQAGEIYGMLNEHVLQTMKSSPYWTPELDKKFETVLGGWAIQTSDTGYGQQAASKSPSSKHVTIAAYNGGWDERESPAEPTDEFRRKALSQTVQMAIPRADELVAWRDAYNAAHGTQFVLGTYEAGPGYNLNGLNGVSMSPAQVEAESRVMKSLTGGTATLDSFLARGERGFVLQNFFTFQRNRHYWTSHARMTSGGQAYPCWSLLALYNREGQGDFLKVEATSTPTIDIDAPPKSRRKTVKDAPLVACYATRAGDRVNVFVLSRRVDATTPVTLALPFKSASKITLHKMAGDPAAHNLDAENVKLESSEIAPESVKDGQLIVEGGLPPAATYLLVFEGTR